MDAVSETGLGKIAVAMKKLLLTAMTTNPNLLVYVIN